MTPLELYREGRLREAITALGEELRSNPLDVKRRTFLFELLLFAGEYDRAEKQLGLLAEGSANAPVWGMFYRGALQCERKRQSMFATREFPTTASGPAVPGLCNGEPFTQLIDADPRIGANLEVFMAGSYSWIPMRYVRRFELDPPTRLRDLVWSRAQLQVSADFPIQNLGEVLVPVLAPRSFEHSDEVVRLGRECAWEADEHFGEVPFGIKTFLVDGQEKPLLDLRLIEWPGPAQESADAH
jgi:type VI secretion system protein ImpE